MPRKQAVSGLRHRAKYDAVKVSGGCKHCKGQPDNPTGATTVKGASVTHMSGGKRTMVKGTCSRTGLPTTVFLRGSDEVE